MGSVLFALSLTPSLLPRTPLIQGLLSGCVLTIGYALGAAVEWLWRYLELRLPSGRVGHWLRLAVAAFCIVLVATFLFLHAGWQNSLRAAMGMEASSGGYPLLVLLVALLPATPLILFGTLLSQWVQSVSRYLLVFVPRRVALLGGLMTVGILAWALFSGVLIRGALHALDAAFLQLDQVAGQFGEAPTDPLKSGSGASLIDWSTIGQAGRLYVNTGPSASDIEGLTGRTALQPLRVHVGLRSANTTQARARLALDELQRIGAFDRAVLVIIMPTGTGWVDPPSIDALEYLESGDVASVSLQYSYLPSPLSLLVDPDYGTEAAQALFDAVYRHWTSLRRDSRPRLYLSGLSLGAHASQSSTQFFDVFGDPFDGALWVGPPFTSPVWRWATRNRRPDSPAWQPIFGDNTSIRFAVRGTDLNLTSTPWGPMRIAFLQYPTDPIVFFEISTFYREPEWLIGQRGEGVSTDLTWYPIVTFLQLGMDMAVANESVRGYGHVYSPSDYIDAWAAILEPTDWDRAQLDSLKTLLEASTGE